jgi:hypothetical protein
MSSGKIWWVIGAGIIVILVAGYFDTQMVAPAPATAAAPAAAPAEPAAAPAPADAPAPAPAPASGGSAQ